MTRSSRSAHAGGDRSIFEHSIVPMWEEDISRLRELIAEWRKQAGDDLRGYLRARPALVREGVHAIQVVDVNSAALELYEAESKKDLLGALDATLDPGALETFVELFAAIAEGSGHVESESTARTLSGRKLDVLVKTFIPAPQDAHSAMVVNVVDFTEYKELKKSLQEQQALVRSVIDSIPDQLFVKDQNERFILANRAVSEWAGRTSNAELIGKTAHDLFPKEAADYYSTVDRQVITSGIGTTRLEEIISSNGQRAWTLTSILPFYGPSGAISGVIGIVRDMTERRKLEMEIEEERTLLRTVVKHVPDLIFLKDAEGRFLVANQAVADTMHAGTPERLIGKTDFDFHPRRMAEEYAADERRLMETGSSIVNKEELKTVNGQERLILTTKVPLFDAQGKAIGVVGVGRDISLLKQAQQALVSSEEKYRTLVEDIGVGILSADADGVITFANPMVGQIFGLALGAARGRKIREYISETAFAQVAKEVDRRKTGDKNSYEMPIVRSDGAMRWIHLNAVSRFDTSGRYTGTFATMQDVTQRHMLEVALSRQRTLMQALMDNVPDLIYFKDRESRFILNNKQHARMLGFVDPAEMIGKTDFDVFRPDFARKAFEDEQRIIRTGQPIINEVGEEPWPGRPSAWVSSTKMPLRDEQGKIIGTFGVSRDMTERRRMEEKNLRLAAMIESSNDAIIGIGLDDTVTSWNKGAETIFGYTAEEMIGKSITPLLSPEIMTQEPTLRERMGREGHVLHTESTVTRKDGRSIYVSTSISVITDAEGQIAGITFISRDVTDQKALQVQIIRAQRLESLGTLASGIAHQFNNINTAVRGYLDFLSLDANLPASTRTYIREALKAVQRAVDITDRLQGLSAGASSTSSEGLHLEEAVPAIVALFDKTLEMEGIRLELDFPRMPAVSASHSALEFIVTSLLTNAVHALSGCAAPSITIRGRSEAGFCSLEMSDNGCGIPAEDLPRIFTPFFTTKGEWAEHGSRQARVKGIGLSLAVCQSTVAERGGWIEVESPGGGGATFRVWLPTASQDTGS